MPIVRQAKPGGEGSPGSSGSGYTVGWSCWESGIVCGRPLRHHDHLVRASLRVEGPTALPDSPLHAGAARMWARQALEEHASIGAFARLGLELLAFGAPLELLAQTQQAGLDEVRHAQDALALAARFSGQDLTPGALLPPGATVELAPTLSAFAVHTLIDGCLNETLATAHATAQLAQATDPQVREALQRVVADETRHAKLAWATVAWALRDGGAPVREALIDALQRYVAPPVLASDEPAQPSLGVLPEASQRAIQHQALEHVITPTLLALGLPTLEQVVCSEPNSSDTAGPRQRETALPEPT